MVWRWEAVSQTLGPGTAAVNWQRAVMEEETAALIRALPYSEMCALEISGDKWKTFGFRSYQSLDHTQYDVCQDARDVEVYDLIIIEQVLEHVLWPFRAVRNLHTMLRPGGFLLVTTPFLIKVHKAPVDCSRWTELGMKHLIAEGGFSLDSVRTGSWGNRMCVRRGLRRTPHGIPLIPWWHSLRNEPEFPVVVWALAQKNQRQV